LKILFQKFHFKNLILKIPKTLFQTMIHKSFLWSVQRNCGGTGSKSPHHPTPIVSSNTNKVVWETPTQFLLTPYSCCKICVVKTFYF